VTRVQLRTVAPIDRQAAVDRWVASHPEGRRAILTEGFGSFTAPDGIAVAGLGGGCVCCVGQVLLRVTLTRLMRAERPEHLLLLLSDDQHLPRIQSLLTDGSLGVRLELEET
jgi:G3E family GTPase